MALVLQFEDSLDLSFFETVVHSLLSIRGALVFAGICGYWRVFGVLGRAFPREEVFISIQMQSTLIRVERHGLDGLRNEVLLMFYTVLGANLDRRHGCAEERS